MFLVGTNMVLIIFEMWVPLDSAVSPVCISHSECMHDSLRSSCGESFQQAQEGHLYPSRGRVLIKPMYAVGRSTAGKKS